MRVQQMIGGVGAGPVSTVQPVYNDRNNAVVMNRGSVGVSPSTLPIVDQKMKVDLFNGVEPIKPVVNGISGFDLNKAYNAVKCLIDMCPNTPEFMVYSHMLNELGNNGAFNKDDSRTLDKVMSAVISHILEEILDRDTSKFANLMETISRRGASVDITPDNISKWIGNGSGRFNGQSLVQQAINAFRVYMMENSLKGFDNIGKFKKHFNNFATKKPEYKDVLVSEAWNVYQGGVR